MEKDLSLKQIVVVSCDELSRVKMRPSFARPSFARHFVFYTFAVFVLLFMPWCDVFADNGAVDKESLKIMKIVEAHKKALNIYKTKRDTSGAMIIMRDSGINDIIEIKPNTINIKDYVNILNDYGYFLSNRSSEKYNDLSIKVLRRVLAISPDRTPAYLNLGDVLFDKLKYVFSYSEKINIAKDIEESYRCYRKLSKKKIDRVDRFIERNISHDKSKTICEYILNNVKGGLSYQMLSEPRDEENPSLCDIDLDGKKEFFCKISSGRRTFELMMKKKASDEWTNCDELNAYENDVDPVEYTGGEGGWEEFYGHVGIIPYKDGVYYIRYGGSDENPEIFYVLKLFIDRKETACIFKTNYTEFIGDECKDKEICNYVKKTKKLNYVKDKKKYNVKIDSGFLFEQTPEENSSVDFNPFVFKSKVYIEVKSTPGEQPLFHEIWEINNSKKQVVCRYVYLPYNVPIFEKSYR